MTVNVGGRDGYTCMTCGTFVAYPARTCPQCAQIEQQKRMADLMSNIQQPQVDWSNFAATHEMPTPWHYANSNDLIRSILAVIGMIVGIIWAVSVQGWVAGVILVVVAMPVWFTLLLVYLGRRDAQKTYGKKN